MSKVPPQLRELFFVLVQHATRAGWSTVVRRIAENAMLTLPVIGLLALPLVLVGAHDVYHWTHLDDPAVLNDPILAAKRPWLNEGFFRVRMFIYIGVWALLAYLYWGWSTKQDTARDPIALTHKMRWTAPLGIVLFEVLTGEWPYTYDSKRDLLQKVMFGQLERHPATKRDTIPGWLDQIVARALSLDREKRFANAGDMRDSLVVPGLGALPGPERLPAVSVQLAAYRMAWAALSGAPPERVRAAFHYVRQDRTLRPVDLLDINGLRELLHTIPPAE